MAIELEYKLAISNLPLLKPILNDPIVLTLTKRPYETTKMCTIYYDTKERKLAQNMWTLRSRMEDTCSVVTLKTPGSDHHTRCEYEIKNSEMNKPTLEKLVSMGAPQSILSLCDGQLICIAGAEFSRQHTYITFQDGTIAEIAGDHGILRGATQILPFTELELELITGNVDTLSAFVSQLCAKYHLHEEPKSKFARAKDLK